MKCLTQLFIIPLLIVLVPVSAVYACSCSSNNPLDVAYEKTPIIATFRVASVEKYKEAEGRSGSGEVKSAILSVQMVYKGSLTVGERFTFTNEGICILRFDEHDIGDEYLLFLHKRPSTGEAWAAGFCTRSGRVVNRTADLLYLDSREKVVGKTRLSGSVNSKVQDSENPVEYSYKDVPNLVLRIRGMGRDFKLKTDQHGVFEVYDLQPGKYRIESPIINGFVHRTHDQGALEVEIVRGRHTEISIFYDIDNSISGKLLDNSGQPMSNVCDLDLVPTKFTLPSYARVSACTDHNGEFSFSSILPGEYVLVGNKEDKITSRAPFPRFYFSSSSATTEGATKVVVEPGTRIKDLKVVAPAFEGAVTINGRALYSDGKPWVNGSVWFYTGIGKASERSKFYDSDSLTTTDADGNFTIRILKGVKGILSGSFRADRREFKKCPKIADLIEAKRDSLSWADIETIPFQIDTNQEISEVALTFPFPSCDGTRRR